jgi:hypothetical protein
MHDNMQTYGEVDIQLHVFLIFALERDDLFASRHGRFITEHSYRLQNVAKRKILPTGKETPVVPPVV